MRGHNNPPIGRGNPDLRVSVPDAGLACAARGGDKGAFVEIVARHQAMVCGIALGVLGDFAASEDVAQEAFLTAWRKIHELREPERLRSWLGQIARNTALGHLRRRRAHDSLESAPVLADEAPTPDEAAATQEEAELVRASLAKLPENYRLPLILYYREGQSVRAVAEALAISEDAVKQRLARGRELLRDRMSGLIETVLTRTGPTPAFTVAIAVAIGGLAAPATVASGVFSAAAVASAGSGGSATVSSLLTAMSTSKSFLIAAAVIAAVCIPVGYFIEPSHDAAPPVSASRPEAQASAAPVPAPSFENSALVAEWRRLHETYGTTGAAMPALYKAIADLKDPFRRRAFGTALIAEWVQLDPAGGLAFIIGKGPDSQQRRQFLEEWLALDPASAINSLLGSGPGWEEMARESLSDVARRAPSRLAEIASRLPQAESYYEKQVRDAFAIVAEGSLSSARLAAELVTGPSQQEALGGVARAWAKNDLDAAIAWVQSLPPGPDRDELIREALLGKAAVNPAAALELVGLVLPGGRYAHSSSTTASRVLAQAAQADFDDTVAWLAAHPAEFGHEDLMALSGAVTERLNADLATFLSAHAIDGSLTLLVPGIESALLNNAASQRAAVWDWLKTQPETDEVQALKKNVLSFAAFQDPPLALKLVQDLPATPQADDEVKDMARSLFNGGHMLYRFDKLVSEAPDRLRQPLIEAAFDWLNAATFSDPQLWISRLNLLPENAQGHAIESIARAWATHTPEEAISWAASLAPGEARTGAVAAVAAGWASQDASSAADWVESLPPGTDRDRSVQSLVSSIAERFPQEAWKWALSLQDPDDRNRAAAQAAKMMAARDPAMARQWIENGPFSSEAKSELQTSLRANRPRGTTP